LFRVGYNNFKDIPAWNRIQFRHLVVSQPLKEFPNIYAIRYMFYLIFPEHSPEPDNSISGDLNIKYIGIPWNGIICFRRVFREYEI